MLVSMSQTSLAKSQSWSISMNLNMNIVSGIGEYASISLILIFKRRINFYIVRVYIPSILLVVTGGLSTLVPLTYVPGTWIDSPP